MITYETIHSAYFSWLVRLVCDGHFAPAASHYMDLLQTLNTVYFTYSMDMDGNQAIHGTELRYRFGSENGISEEDIACCLDQHPCTILEMMVSLADRIESNITTDDTYGNRTGKWFFEMVSSLGLDTQNDSNFDIHAVLDCLDRFLHRDYAPDGEGGLFTVPNYRYDMRDLEIWYQAMAYLNECVYGGDYDV